MVGLTKLLMWSNFSVKTFTRNLFRKTQTMSWQEEKERLAGLSQEDRRKEYFCGDEFVKLEEVNTWKTDALYKSKLANPKTREDPEKLKKELITEQMNLDLDLSSKVSTFVGDITKLEIDGIVNAANNSLLGGGGVDGAIHRAAGKYLLEENKTLGGCPDGEARLSGGYRLPAKYVVSTVGPRGLYPDVLEAAYNNCLQMMLDNKLRSIAFPCISTGIYGYPNKDAANVALRTTRAFLEKHHQDVDRVIFCLFLQKDVQIYGERMPIIFPSVAKDDVKEADTAEESENKEEDEKVSNEEEKEAATPEKNESKGENEELNNSEEANKSKGETESKL